MSGTLHYGNRPSSRNVPFLNTRTKTDTVDDVQGTEMYCSTPSLETFRNNLRSDTYFLQSCDSSAGRSGFDSRQGLGIFLFAVMARLALEPTQSPIQWVPGAVYVGVKRPGREADHTLPSSAEVKNAWSYTSTPSVHLHGVVLSLE
jgi:hypothetical protein